MDWDAMKVFEAWLKVGMGLAHGHGFVMGYPWEI